MMPPNKPRVRCAIYTRKSSEEGLDMEFNSLDAQREACEAYIASQKSEGWTLIGTRYDDGGFSGKNTERPAFQRLMEDIQGGKIDLVAVYKIDRISRSLPDFVKMIEVFDQHKVTFVSITQSFNTATSMGRLIMNVLMSFAQFERETISERIRDKHEASRKKGIWMGGCPPFGYDVISRKLIVNKEESAIVREIFSRFADGYTSLDIVRSLRAKGCATKEWTTQKGKLRRGRPIHMQYIYRILSNRVYLGEAVHKGNAYPGEHQAVIDLPLWENVRRILALSPTARCNATRAKRPPALLKGFVRCGCCGSAMSPTASTVRKHGQSYRYYVCVNSLREGSAACPIRSIPAEELESAVLYQIKAAFKGPELIAAIARQLKTHGPEYAILTIKELEKLVRHELKDFDSLWQELFAQEQRKLLSELLESVDVSEEGIKITLKQDALTRWIKEIPHEENGKTAYERGSEGVARRNPAVGLPGQACDLPAA